MVDEIPQPEVDAYAYIERNIDSVPHLEALVLLWNSRPVGWTCEEMASRLYLRTVEVAALLGDLVRLRAIAELPGAPLRYAYLSRSKDQDDLMWLIDAAYRRDLVRISTMIHSKASSPVREFARAFRMKKDSNQP
ncbi:MAG: hypothetical protein NVSMB62_24640 [Acidobacteriaceae bacterium]